MKRDRRNLGVDPSAPLLVNDVVGLAARSDDPASAETVRHWARTGRLRAVKTPGGVHVFDRRDVITFLQKRAAERRAREEERHTHREPQPAA